MTIERLESMNIERYDERKITRGKQEKRKTRMNKDR